MDKDESILEDTKYDITLYEIKIICMSFKNHYRKIQLFANQQPIFGLT
jgi:hypothetical protein